MAPWPNGQGVGLLIRRLRVRVPQGVLWLWHSDLSEVLAALGLGREGALEVPELQGLALANQIQSFSADGSEAPHWTPCGCQSALS